MAQAIVNPEDVKRFAAQLRQFSGDLQNRSSQLNGQFRQLGDSWRDQEYNKFSQEFDQTLRVIRQFLETADSYTQYLARKADSAQRYLDQH